MADQITNEQLTTAALGPKKVEGDEATVEQHSLKDLIAAKEKLDANAATASAHQGIRCSRLRLPGATS